MKKMAVWLLAAGMALLWGCQARGFDTKQVAETYGAANEVTAQMDIRTSYDVMQEYTLSYKRGAGVAQVSILAPEVLSGITAHLKEGECVLIYDGVSVETLMPAVPGFSPADAMHGLLEDLIHAAPVDYTYEKVDEVNLLALTYGAAQEEYTWEKRVWLDEETLAVNRCEFFLDGQLMMTMTVTAFGVY